MLLYDNFGSLWKQAQKIAYSTVVCTERKQQSEDESKTKNNSCGFYLK